MSDPELRRIRDGVEVIAMCLTFLVLFVTIFSGWAFPKPTGLSFAGAWVATILAPFWIAKSIREVR